MARKLDAHERNELAAMIQRTSRAEVLRYIMQNRQWADHTGARIRMVEIDAEDKLIIHQ